MQDLLKKIVEMDVLARKIEQEAKAEKVKSEEEIEHLREQIYDDYISRAKDRIEKNISVDRARAEEKLADFRSETEKAKSNMRELYADNKERWIAEIVARSLN